jgi:hypothetical protein
MIHNQLYLVFSMTSAYPQEQELYVGGIETARVNIALRIYSGAQLCDGYLDTLHLALVIHAIYFYNRVWKSSGTAFHTFIDEGIQFPMVDSYRPLPSVEQLQALINVVIILVHLYVQNPDSVG